VLAYGRPVHQVHQAARTPRVRRAAVLLTSLTAALGLSFAFAASAAPTTANAATWLRYQRGYSVQGSWLCYGWSGGTYHCTQRWNWNQGERISTHTSWVPDYYQGGGKARTSAPPTSVAHTTAPHVTYQHVVTHSAPVRSAPPAPSSNVSGGSVQSMIRSIFGAYGNQALNVAACESGFNPNALNRSSGASGVFQFLHSTWMTTSYAGYSPFNAWANINAAHQVFARDGNSWREWSCGYRA
jgi:hypothetical protein